MDAGPDCLSDDDDIVEDNVEDIVEDIDAFVGVVVFDILSVVPI